MFPFGAPSRRRFIAPALLGATSMALLAGCQRGRIGEVGDSPTAEELVGYYSPRSIKILPFTKPRSFDMKDDLPDGIAVSLRPLDAEGDSTKAYGTFLFELYTYRPATADHKGELLQTWSQPILNPKDQQRFWERVTATYEFQLDWAGSPIPPQQKYILVASFEAPGSQRLFDKYEFEFRITREDILNAAGDTDAPQ